MSGEQQQTISDPDWIDVFNQLRKNIFLELNCVHVGKVFKVDFAEQTIQAQVSYKKTIYKENTLTKQYEPTFVDYPLILDCPFISLRGGHGSLRFPIKKGDECLLLFNDRDISDWFNGSSASPPPSFRLHSLSDGFALVGISSLSNLLTDYDEDRTELRHVPDKENLHLYAELSLSDTDLRALFSKDADTKIGVTYDATGAYLRYGTDAVVAAKLTKVLIANKTKNLKVITQTLIDRLTDLTGAINDLIAQTAAISVPYASPGGPATSGPPVDALLISAITTAQITPIVNALANIKTDLGVLLE